MRTEGCEADLLRTLASMPFLDRTEMVAVSGWSRGAVYEAVEKMDRGGFCDAVTHAADLSSPTERYYLTAEGLKRLAGEEGMSLDELLRSRPVSAQWRRSLMERLDALATVYPLAGALAAVAYPIRFRWYRSLSLDAAVALPDGRTVGIVRRGNTSDRSAFSNRVWRLRGTALPGAVLILMPDPVRLRHSRRMLEGFPVPAFLAVESEVVAAPDGAVWSPHAVRADIDLSSALDRIEKRDNLPEEAAPERTSLPSDFTVQGRGWDNSDYMLPVMLKAAEKRAVELVADWPWIALTELAGLMRVSHQRASQLVIPLEFYKLVARPRDAGGHLAPTDRGLARLARRDRTSVGLARRRWSSAPLFTGDSYEWTGVTGRRTRQLLRHIEHTAAVHDFLAHLTTRRSWSAGRSPSSTHPRGPPATSGTATGSARSIRTPSVSSEEERQPGLSSWSGRGALCAQQPCRSVSPPIFVITHLTGPPTTTALGPTSWSYSTTRSRRPTSCAWQGRRCRRKERPSPCGSPTGSPQMNWGRWDEPGVPPVTGTRPRPCRRSDQ